MIQRTATCGCGDIRITVQGDPEACWACHCDYCQRLSGSLGSFASVFDDLPKWPGAQRNFCPKCGTSVHWINPSAFPGKRLIAIGCFADKDFPGPQLSVHTNYRHDWLPSFHGAEDFETLPSEG